MGQAMTTFRFNTFNHCEDGKRCIEDLTIILSAQFRALGYKTEIFDEFSYTEDCINLLYESFADACTIQTIHNAYYNGARFVYIATEEPHPAGFNGRLDNAMDARQRAFPEAARYAEAILHLAPGEQVTRWYANYAPASYVEIGYVEELVALPDNVDPPYDFGFYGQMTQRRRRVFDSLGTTLLELPFITHTAAERDALMLQVKVIPQIRAHDSQEIISSSRCATALHLGRPVVAEPHGIPGAWKEVISFSKSAEEFYEDASFAVRHWRELYAVQFALFAERMSPERCLGKPLRAVGL